MTWLAENSLPAVGMGAVLIAALIGGWWKTGRRELLYGVALVVVLCVAALIYEWRTVTPREEVRQALFGVARSVEKDNVDAVLERFENNAESFRSAVRNLFRQFRVDQVKIKSNLRIEVHMDRSPPAATAEFNAVAVGGSRDGTIRQRNYPQFVIVKYVKKGDRWLIKSYELQPPQEGFKKRGP